jgi:hypothetical protein
MSTTEILLIIVILMLAGYTLSDVLSGFVIGFLYLIIAVVVISVLIVALFLNPTLFFIISGILISILIVRRITKSRAKLPDKKLFSGQKINDDDLESLIKNYEKSLDEITQNELKSRAGSVFLARAAQEFTIKFGFDRRLISMMHELHYKYIYFRLKNHPTYKEWQLKVIPVSAIETEIVDYPAAANKEVKLRYKNILIIYSGNNLEVEVNNTQVYKVKIRAVDGVTGYPDIFKPGEWLMEIYNLCIDYKNEESQIVHRALIKEKENNFSLIHKKKK